MSFGLAASDEIIQMETCLSASAAGALGAPQRRAHPTNRMPARTFIHRSSSLRARTRLSFLSQASLFGYRGRHGCTAGILPNFTRSGRRAFPGVAEQMKLPPDQQE